MATNKNALIRYKHLDKLLSDRHHFYDINDLTEKVNDMLYDDGFPEVTRRCIEKDLVYLTEAPFRAPIKRFKWNGKSCVAYKNASFSIEAKSLKKSSRFGFIGTEKYISFTPSVSLFASTLTDRK